MPDEPTDRLEPRASIVNDNAAWCWFQDERALIDSTRRHLLFGSVASASGPGGEARAGNVEVTVVDLERGTSQTAVLHERLEADDHNVPALWQRDDGRWLATYTKHKSDDLLRYRISEPHDPLHWGEERAFDWGELTGGRGVTYSNLHRIDGRLYCFSRAVNDDQCAIVSDDGGETWQYAGKLFTRPKIGYVNGYTRYASDGGRLDIVTTDHHPRDFDNSIYHGYIEAGELRRSDGETVRSPALSDDAPSQERLSVVVAAGAEIEGESVSHCWTTDLRRSSDGTPVAVLTARVDAVDDPADAFDRFRPVRDHRFLYARTEDDGTWTVRQLAAAGPGLLPHEQDYTGLAAIDPHDADSVYISTPIDPRTDEPLAHYEIFSGRTADRGATWTWHAVTEDSEADNLRPIVAPGDPSTVHLLWFQGSMSSSQDFDCRALLLRTPRGARLEETA